MFHLTPYAVARSLASQQMGEDEQGRFVQQSVTLLSTIFKKTSCRMDFAFVRGCSKDVNKTFFKRNTKTKTFFLKPLTTNTLVSRTTSLWAARIKRLDALVCVVCQQSLWLML